MITKYSSNDAFTYGLNELFANIGTIVVIIKIENVFFLLLLPSNLQVMSSVYGNRSQVRTIINNVISEQIFERSSLHGGGCVETKSNYSTVYYY